MFERLVRNLIKKKKVVSDTHSLGRQVDAIRLALDRRSGQFFRFALACQSSLLLARCCQRDGTNACLSGAVTVAVAIAVEHARGRCHRLFTGVGLGVPRALHHTRRPHCVPAVAELDGLAVDLLARVSVATGLAFDLRQWPTARAHTRTTARLPSDQLAGAHKDSKQARGGGRGGGGVRTSRRSTAR